MITLDPKHQNYTVQNPFKDTYEKPLGEAAPAKAANEWSPYQDNGGTVVGKCFRTKSVLNHFSSDCGQRLLRGHHRHQDVHGLHDSVERAFEDL